MSIKPNSTTPEKRSKKRLSLFLGFMVLALAACNANDISDNMRNNMAADVAKTKTAWSEADYSSALETVPKTIRDSTIRIRYLNSETDELRGGGTGLLTEIVKDAAGSSYAIVITAGHVMNGRQEARLSTQLDENVYMSSDNTFRKVGPDLAVVAFRLDIPEEGLPLAFGTNDLQPFDFLSIASNSNFVALGYPNEPDGNGGLVSQSYQFPSTMDFMSFEEGVITFYATASGGMSGCPVVDRNGKLIGFLLGFDPNHGDLVFQNPKHIRIQVLTEEFLEEYQSFLTTITGSIATSTTPTP